MCGCSLGKSVKNNFINCQCKVIDIKEFNSSFRFTALNEMRDTVFMVSTKDNHRNITVEQLDSIYLNQIYDCKLTQLKPYISVMRLGTSFIVGNDTILKIPSYNPQNYVNENLPKVYFVHNVTRLAY